MTDWPTRYLGDGVYARFDGYQVWLSTQGDGGYNEVAVEPPVMHALQDYWKELALLADERREAQESKLSSDAGDGSGS